MRSTFLDLKDNKNTLLKKSILRHCITNGDYSIADLSSLLNTSVPTVTKLIQELIEDGFLVDLGKIGTSGGRRPSIYGLNPDAGYLVGVDIRHRHACIVVSDFKGNVVSMEEEIPFVMKSDEDAIKRISASIKGYFNKKGLDWTRVLGCGISLTGRVNPRTGYSLSFSTDENTPLDKQLEENLGVPVIIENDSRAMTYGEYVCGHGGKEKNILFINISWGLGMGMILDGRLFYGKSGFSGEIGHFPMLDNGKICRCGKIGCLETGASGSALHKMILEALSQGKASMLSPKFTNGEEVIIKDIIAAIKKEDVLAIEKVEEVGANLGRGIAGLINIFNPELVIIGGKLAVAGDYLMLPVKSNVKKLALNIVNRDTKIKFSKLGRLAAPLGDCMLIRSRLLGVL
ncbi:MAG: ROK family transcriptional regulator [Bacteroidales bacterium]|nr:ROK family transcriptional regulator [Bacteroidales bacterium]